MHNNKNAAIIRCDEYKQFRLNIFYNNGVLHNSKNAAYIRGDIYKTFNLNDKIYGFQHSFTKESWRRFTKLRDFL